LEQWINLYDANLRWADWAVGEVEALLRRAGLLQNTLLIVTSDHGEAFGEHGYMSHTCGVYDESVHIPLIMRFPGGEGAADRIGALTQTVDLLPTLFDLFEVPTPAEQIQGLSLVPLLSGDADRVRDCVFARDEGEPASYLVRSLRYALIAYRGGELRALYDLEADPGQTHNIIDAHPERADELIQAFREFAETQRRQPVDFIDPGAQPELLPGGPAIRMTDEMRRQLEALGYLE
jgi:arylsulfatase A-like enzyme